MSERPFDDIRALVRDLPAAAPVTGQAADPFAEMAGWIAAWRGRPAVNRPILVLYAGAHRGVGASFRQVLAALKGGA